MKSVSIEPAPAETFPVEASAPAQAGDASTEVRREAALLKTGALQSAILNSANFSSIATDEKGVIQLFNVGAERMLGYAASEVVDKITPADISDPQEVVARAKSLSLELATTITPGFEALVFKASRGIEDIYELTYIRKDGSRFPAIVSVTALRDDSGGIIGYLLIGTDNTARKHAEEALLKAGALQNAIFSSANFSCIATDEKGVIQVFNVGAERSLGYTASEAVNKFTPAILHDPEEVIARAKRLSAEFAIPIAPGFEALIFKASRGIEDIYELTKIRKDGSRFPAVVSVTALRDAHSAIIIGYLLIGTDNTARHRAEEERMKLDQQLRDQQFYTRSLIESNNDALMATDPRGIITDVNKQTEALTGCTRDELIGAPFKNYFTDPARAEAGINQVLSAGKVTDYELSAQSVDGTVTVVSYNATTFHDRNRNLRGVFAAARDVTERKRFEGKLQETNIELERARAAAESANRAKSVFLSSMSHEIRTPMNAILGMADMLWESQLDVEQMQYVDVFRRAGASLLVLINDILDLSKIESGHLELENVGFNLEEVMNQAIELTAVRARGKGILLISRLVPGLISGLTGDPMRLRQVLINLLGNAIKFTESGEVVLTVRNRENHQAGEIEFSVSDTGIGIAPEKLETIFEDFAQADASTTRSYGGTGLGLGISRRIVAAMGGSLNATSSVGKGSTFRFTAHFVPAPEHVQHVRVVPEDLLGKRVLLIDDNATSCFILRETLEGWGLLTDTFRLPRQALTHLREEMDSDRPYSLAIVDHCMPEMGGFEAAVEIRRIAGELPIVMLSSEANPGDAARRIEAGLSGYAVKPVARTQLLRIVSDATAVREYPGLLPAGSGGIKEGEPVKAARLLVAEDSPDNRLLVQVYLKGSPYHLTFAENGKAAVDQFAASDFDLILMDVRMPVMDGLGATRAIRALERERGSAPVPIIALTANASSQDIERSGAAGCNAHLSKPISKFELLRTIEQYRRPPKPVAPGHAESPHPVRIEMPAGMEDIVPGYLANRRKEIPEMLGLLANSDFERVSMLGHNLKGTARGYGFPDLIGIGLALEQSADRRDGGRLRGYITDLGEYLDRVQLVRAGAAVEDTV